MLVNERQNAIIEYLRENNAATVKQLSSLFYVSEATMRRDLAEMQRLGLIDRSRGGATLPERAGEISMFVRVEKNAKEKEKAAVNALNVLPPFLAAFIDSSSTALSLARRMDFKGKTVVTHSLQTATAISKQKGAEVILLGGNLLYNMTSVSGSWTIAQIREFSFDLSITSCAAISADGTYERSMEQRDIKRAAFSRSRTNILVADGTKFMCSAPFRTAALSAFDKIVLDCPPPENFAEKSAEESEISENKKSENAPAPRFYFG